MPNDFDHGLRWHGEFTPARSAWTGSAGSPLAVAMAAVPAMDRRGWIVGRRNAFEVVGVA